MTKEYDNDKEHDNSKNSDFYEDDDALSDVNDIFTDYDYWDASESDITDYIEALGTDCVDIETLGIPDLCTIMENTVLNHQ